MGTVMSLLVRRYELLALCTPRMLATDPPKRLAQYEFGTCLVSFTPASKSGIPCNEVATRKYFEVSGAIETKASVLVQSASVTIFMDSYTFAIDEWVFTGGEPI